MPKVDLAHYKDREQAYVKHCLLEEYLPEWGYKVGTKWDSLVYVDGFAGAWKSSSPDLADSSSGVAVDAIKKTVGGLLEHSGRQLKAQCILVEKNKEDAEKLKKFASTHRAPGFDVTVLNGEFAALIPAIQRAAAATGGNPFKFVFLDPKGWKDIPMGPIGPFLKGRSSEVLINLMTKHITRFLEEDDRAESYNRLFGRAGVLDLLRTAPRENDERAECAVREYCKSLKQLCDFKYVSSAVILEPNEEKVRYFLVFATNHPRGVEVFKAAEMIAAKIQDQVRIDTKAKNPGQPEFSFDGYSDKSKIVHTLRERYTLLARAKLYEMLRNSDSKKVLYKDLFCEVMAFPLVTPSDLVAWIKSLSPSVVVELAKGTRGKPSPSRDDMVVIVDPRSIPTSSSIS